MKFMKYSFTTENLIRKLICFVTYHRFYYANICKSIFKSANLQRVVMSLRILFIPQKSFPIFKKKEKKHKFLLNFILIHYLNIKYL